MLQRDSSAQEKKYAADAVYEFLADALFDKISFISFPFTKTQQIYPVATDNSPSVREIVSNKEWSETDFEDDGISLIDKNYINYIEGDVTDTERYWGVSRIPNTSEGKFLRPDKSSRMRCSFYVSNGQDLDGYILSPVVYDSFRQLNYFDSMDVFRSYVGLKFLEGQAYVVIKEAGKEEALTPIDLNVGGSGESFPTYRLDMATSGKETYVYIDSIEVAKFNSDMIGDIETVSTFLPLISPARSTTGDPVGIIIENFQFIQNN